MSGDPTAPLHPPDKRRPSDTSLTMVSTIPPETPPLLDPTTANIRYPRLTPNLRDMMQNLSQSTPDANGPMHDLLASPDPTALYNSLYIGSPILRDLYQSPAPVQPTNMPYETPEIAAERMERMERMAGTAAEMNALFTGCYPPNPADPTSYNDDTAHAAGVMSLMSSPDLPRNSFDMSTSGVSSSEPPAKKLSDTQTRPDPTSHSSSQTPPPIDDVFSSPSVSPNVPIKKDSSKKANFQSTPTSTPIAVSSPKRQKTGNATVGMVPRKQQPQRYNTAYPNSSVGSSAPGSSVVSTTAPTSVTRSGSAVGSRSTAAVKQEIAPHGGAMGVSQAMAMSTGMGSFMPFACAMPGMGPFMQMPGALHYQGRPIAFVNGAHGTEFVPVDVLAAQATALQYGAAAQAAGAGNRVMQAGAGIGGGVSGKAGTRGIETVGGSRKKRRRQLLERSGCTEEQARRNRAHALERLRQKKTLRTQKQNTVRYACRKRIAMVRPRVNGRFATKEEVEECQRAQQ